MPYARARAHARFVKCFPRKDRIELCKNSPATHLSLSLSALSLNFEARRMRERASLTIEFALRIRDSGIRSFIRDDVSGVDRESF